MSVSYWLDRSKNHKINCDITIIGAGIAGLSTAYWLQKYDPSLEIVIVDRGEVGTGATGRNAGFITCGSVEHFNRLVGKHGEEEAKAIWLYSEKNLEYLKEEIIQEDKEALLFEERGSFSLASTANEFSELKDSSEIMQKMGIEVEILDEQQIKKRLGALEFVGGIKYCKDASVHPIYLIQKIISRLTKNIQVKENCEVYSIESYNGIKKIKTSKLEIDSPMVIMATNGYSALMHPYFVDKIFPTRGQILATEPVPRFMEGPCYANFVLDYFRQIPTGEMIIGGFRQLQKDAEKGYSDEITPVIQDALEEFLKRHIPNVKNAKITHRWSGIMGFSVDGQPLVGSLPGDEQLFFLGGFTGHGLGLAFHSAKVLADSLMEKGTIPKFVSAKRFI